MENSQSFKDNFIRKHTMKSDTKRQTVQIAKEIVRSKFLPAGSRLKSLSEKIQALFFLNRKGNMCQRGVPRSQRMNPAENNELRNPCHKAD